MTVIYPSNPLLYPDQELTNTVGGLEVYFEPDDTWYPVPYVPDAFVVNIGDMLGKL
jgi:isopenicillin N synthase-like dioxygenase